MKKIKYWEVAALIGLLIFGSLWWAISEVKERKDPLNKADAFVYRDNGLLYWFDLTSRKGKVDGKLHQQKIKEESGKPPLMEEKKYPLTGETTEKGYEFKVNNGGKVMTYDARFSGANLLVQKQGEKDSKLYKAVDEKDLDLYVKTIQQELQIAVDQSEEKEKARLNKFFSELDSIYGYLYSTEKGSSQLFIKIDEALHQGELTGSLLMMNKSNSYEETRYVLNGITDGLMVQFFTTVDGKETSMKGDFHEGATGFDLSFWMTDQKLSFHAVTEEEFKQRYKEFKTNAQR